MKISNKKIGIITGSGPEAGLDLWQKILDYNKVLLKDEFKGDLNAPNVTILSVAKLGHSMELEKNYDIVWETLKKCVEDISSHVDYFVIACNTLNLYANKIEEIGYKDKFISTLDVIDEYIQKESLNQIAIIGALPVIQMGEFSVFKPLNEKFDVEVPLNFDKVQKLIYDVKRVGGNDLSVISNFKEILEELNSSNVFLACTELPLIKLEYKKKNLVDVTDLLAKKLIDISYL
jgi:aspartate racemase